jgi:crossover junction endodeoxyribonuclease RuvC
MRVLGLDVSSSSTGWSIVERSVKENEVVLKLREFGLIKPDGNMGVTQRLYFFGNELSKVIEKHQPTDVAIEETIFVRSPVVMRTLARFSGVAIYLAYKYQKKEISMYEPSMWKKGLGLKGSAVKSEIQLRVCEIFSLISKDKINNYKIELEKIAVLEENSDNSIAKILKEQQKNLEILQKQQKERKREINKKRKKEITEIDLKELEEMPQKVETISEIIKTKKKELNAQIKDINSKYLKVSTDIYSDTGVNNDVADSCGVALHFLLNENKTIQAT